MAPSLQLADLSNQKGEIQLGPPPGAKKRSGVTAPACERKTESIDDRYDDMSSDLEIEPPPELPENMDYLHSDSEDEIP